MTTRIRCPKAPPPEVAASWRRLRELVAIENDDAAAGEAVAVLQQQLTNCYLGETTPGWAWFSVSRVLGRDEKRTADRAFTAADVSRLFELALNAASVPATRDEEDEWGTLIDIADTCPSYVAADVAKTMRARILAEVAAGAGEHAERQRHAWRALVHVRPAAWFDDNRRSPVFEAWFRNHLHGDALRLSFRFLPYFTHDVRLDLLRHLVDTEGRLDARSESRTILNESGRLLAAWSLWWEQSWARDLTQRWCEAEQRPGALADPDLWRAFLSGFAWGLQNEVRHASDPRTGPGLARFAPLLEMTWSAWCRVVVDELEGVSAVGFSITTTLSKRYTTKVGPPAGGWAASMRTLLPRVIREGGRDDILALRQIEWAEVDGETLMLAADATIERADRELITRPVAAWTMEGLISALGGIGTRDVLPAVRANAVLDCLQRLGTTIPRANALAATVERELRARGL